MNPENRKKIASISLDLDNKWSYMKTHGDTGWEKFPSYFDILIPQVLSLLDELGLKITFFVVGQDAVLDKNRNFLQEITSRGHEVGNHSFHHEPWLHLYSFEELKKEVLDAEDAILNVIGQKPVGFRGPGFSWNNHLLEILEENDYMYDATTLPMYIGPLARLYYFWSSHLSKQEKKERKDLYGSFKDGLRPVKPYLWQLPSGKELLEIPVTTMPIFKIPLHLSYLLYINRFSKTLMFGYLKFGNSLCKITKTSISFLLHPLDFLSGAQVPELNFFPGMKLNVEDKLDIFRRVITILSHKFELVNMSTHAKFLKHNKKLKIIEVKNG